MKSSRVLFSSAALLAATFCAAAQTNFTHYTLGDQWVRGTVSAGKGFYGSAAGLSNATPALTTNGNATAMNAPIVATGNRLRQMFFTNYATGFAITNSNLYHTNTIPVSAGLYEIAVPIVLTNHNVFAGTISVSISTTFGDFLFTREIDAVETEGPYSVTRAYMMNDGNIEIRVALEMDEFSEFANGRYEFFVRQVR